MGSFIGAVSSASRTMIMTGYNVWNIRNIFYQSRKSTSKYPRPCGNADIVEKGSPVSSSLPVLFHNAGYETYRTCKSGNSYD